MASADPFGWVGATIDGKFRVEAVVGEGGFGVVYRGQHLGFNEPVALKCLKLPGALDGAEREKFHATFLEEGRLLHRLSKGTAGIVQALDVGAAISPSGVWTPYLVLEWLEGSPLDQDLSERRARGEGGRSVAEAISFLAPAARALQVAHAQGVAHRDIKPANLFLATVGGVRTLKVLDFGIAKVLSSVSSLTQALSETGASVKAFTPQYGAPEQFHRRFGATGPWTDVFALGLVVIEVASGRSALEGGDTTQLFIASTDLSFRPTLKAAGVEASAGVEAVLAKALAVEPRERYHSAGELWDALEAAAPDAVNAVNSSNRGVTPATRARITAPEELGAMATGEYLGLQGDTESAGATFSKATSAAAATGTANTEAAPAQLPPVVATHATKMREPPPSSPPPAPSKPPPSTRSPTPDRPGNKAGVAIGAGITIVALGALAFQLTRKPVTPPPPAAPVVESAPKAPPAPPPDMVRVPAGKFMMGSEAGGKTEKPAHEVTFTRAFAIDRNEVTAGDYQSCVKAGKCSASSVHGPHVEPADVEKRGPLCTAVDPGKARHPITCVDQAQAAAYCTFVSKRLPTEAEWEYAARGPDERDYPWGNDVASCERANVARNPGQGCGRPKGTQEVGLLTAGASPFGALDLAGNAWEWVADGWDPNAYSKGAQTDPRVAASGDKAVLRGGSWDFAAVTAKATFRLSFDRAAGDLATGFRCARTME
jgi:serine/threonine-protein kinase